MQLARGQDRFDAALRLAKTAPNALLQPQLGGLGSPRGHKPPPPKTSMDWGALRSPRAHVPPPPKQSRRGIVSMTLDLQDLGVRFPATQQLPSAKPATTSASSSQGGSDSDRPQFHSVPVASVRPKNRWKRALNVLNPRKQHRNPSPNQESEDFTAIVSEGVQLSSTAPALFSAEKDRAAKKGAMGITAPPRLVIGSGSTQSHSRGEGHQSSNAGDSGAWIGLRGSPSASSGSIGHRELPRDSQGRAYPGEDKGGGQRQEEALQTLEEWAAERAELHRRLDEATAFVETLQQGIQIGREQARGGDALSAQERMPGCSLTYEDLHNLRQVLATLMETELPGMLDAKLATMSQTMAGPTPAVFTVEKRGDARQEMEDLRCELQASEQARAELEALHAEDAADLRRWRNSALEGDSSETTDKGGMRKLVASLETELRAERKLLR
ncbi:unnamed protein product, partial [Chrysoparadoxa australica]